MLYPNHSLCISEEKIAEDCKWDGLKGYITNTDLDAERVIDQYHGLWVVERAFRISKGTLEMRPMYHFYRKKDRSTHLYLLHRL